MTKTEPISSSSADYAEPLKMAWAEIDCPYSSPCKSERPCRGHAALLEMVDAYIKEVDYKYPEGVLRRRLHAVVGVGK